MREQLAARGWDVFWRLRGARFLIARPLSTSCTEAVATSRLLPSRTRRTRRRILSLLRAGARDYVVKDNLFRLPSAIQRELLEAEGRRQRKRSRPSCSRR